MKTRYHSLANWLIGALSLLVAVPATVHAGGDHGSNITTATTVGLNSMTAGSLGTFADNDYFRIDLSAATVLVVETTGTTDTLGQLLDSAGMPLTSDDNSGDGINFRIRSSLAAGTYYVRVRHAVPLLTGDYTLVVSAGSDDHGDSIGTATLISANSSTSGVLEAAGDNDYFRINLNARGALTLQSTGSTDTFGHLLDSTGMELASNDDISSQNRNFQITAALDPGTYYVRVRHFSSQGTGPYTLVASFDSHGSSDTTATRVAANSNTPGELELVGDMDYFRIELSTSARLIVQTTGMTDTFGELFDATTRLFDTGSGGLGELIASNDDADSSNANFRIVQNLSAGTYFVRVSHSQRSGTGNYVLSIALDAQGDGLSSAADLSVNTRTPAAIDVAGDNDFFRISLPESGMLILQSEGATDTLGRLLDSRGNELAMSDDTSASDTNFSIQRSLAAGSYFVQVRHAQTSGTGGYALLAQFVPDSGDDHGGTMSSSTFANPGGTLGRIDFSGDSDLFQINTGSEFCNPLGSSSSGDTVAGDLFLREDSNGLGNARLVVYTTGNTDTFGRLLDGQGNVIASADGGGRNSNFLLDVGNLFCEQSLFLEITQPTQFALASTYTVAYAIVQPDILPDLSVAQTLSMDPPSVGRNVTVQVAVNNLNTYSGDTAGLDLASRDVKLYTKVPAGTSLVQMPAGCSYSDALREVTCSIDRVDPGLPVSRSIVMQPDVADDVTFTSEVESLASAEDVQANNRDDLDTTVQPAASSEIVNISTRGRVETGNNVLIGGFILVGTSPRTVVVRALGRTIGAASALGSDRFLSDPTLELFSQATGTLVARNDNWQDGTLPVCLASGSAAADLTPNDTGESVIVATLAPGAYTAIVRFASGVSGLANVSVNVLESDCAGTSNSDSTLFNISTRGRVGTGDNVLIGGFIIAGTAPKTVLVRGLGPTVAANSTINADQFLSDPTLQVRAGDGTLVEENDNWQTGSFAACVLSSATAATLAPSSASEPAALLTLTPGAYTAIVRGVGGSTGLANVAVNDFDNICP